MSITGEAPTSLWSCDTPQSDSPQGEKPQRELAHFLTRESSRYIPLPYMFRSDAIFCHRWFATNLFVPSHHPDSQRTERLLEFMDPNFSCATVMGIKLLLVNRNNEDPSRFRLRWSKEDEYFSEVFLISVFGLPDHVAVIPRSYLQNRYGDASSVEEAFELDQACPSLLAPFMVHYRDLVQFLCDIYEHASTSATTELVNPTYGAVYHEFKPELQRLHNIMPRGGSLDKLLRMRELYFACRAGGQIMSLSPRDEAGHFMLDGHPVEYHKRSFYRAGKYGDYLRIALRHQLSSRSTWQFLFLEDRAGMESICLPRHLVPAHLIGPARHGRHSRYDTVPWPQVEVVARPFVPFMFLTGMPPHTAMAIAAIMMKYPQQTETGISARGSIGSTDSGYESSFTRRTRSGMENWILKVLHKET